MFWEIASFVVEKVGDWGYTGIFVMMTIESSFIPFPSEIAMIPAWYLSSIWEMNLYLAFLAGTLWAIFWASINYFLWMTLWWPIIRGIIHKYGKYIFLSASHYDAAEVFFQKHWVITTFNARFIPAVRQLISLPAGVFKMHFGKFVFFTALWAGIWNGILLWIWYIAGQNKDLITQYSKEAILGVILFVILASIIYYIANKKFVQNNQ